VKLLPLLLLLAVPAAVRAQFTWTTNNGTITITGCSGFGGAVTLPGMINGLSVTSIGDFAFAYNGLTSVTIPNSVTNIGEQAFYSCTGLTNATIGNGVTTIKNDAFAYCASLASAAIGNSVSIIGDSVFHFCTSLANVTIPNSVTAIGLSAFADCHGLTHVTIGNSVTNIGVQAFSGCTSLTSVTIPSSVTTIWNGAFDGCTSLTSVCFLGTPPNLYASFPNNTNAVVYYLPGITGWDWASTFGGLPTVLWNLETDNLGVRTNRFGFTLTGTTNLVVVVEASTSLEYPKWIPVGTNTLTGGSSYFSDPRWTNIPVRFYRLRSP
jgi:hypothetical protein